MYFEEYFFFSHEAMNSGYGFRLAFGYLTFPFVPTLVTRYVIARSPALTAFQVSSSFPERPEWPKRHRQPWI